MSDTDHNVAALRAAIDDMQRTMVYMQAHINDLQLAQPPSRITRLRRRLAAIILGGPVPS